MKKLKRWLTGILAGIMLTGTLAAPCNAMAGGRVTNPNVVSLSQGREYTNLDATGDGKADSLYLETRREEKLFSEGRNFLEISINGRRAFRLRDPYYKGDATDRYEVKLCTLSRSNVLFFVRTISETDHCNFCRLYRYRNGRFQPVLNLKDTYKNMFHYREYIDVSGAGRDRIQFRWYGQIGVTGALNWTVTYADVGGSLRRQGRTCPTLLEDRKKTWTAQRGFRVYETAKLAKEVFRVRPGDKVKVMHVYNDAKRLYVRIVNQKGQAGWVPCPNDSSPYFKESIYVG